MRVLFPWLEVLSRRVGSGVEIVTPSLKYYFEPPRYVWYRFIVHNKYFKRTKTQHIHEKISNYKELV